MCCCGSVSKTRRVRELMEVEWDGRRRVEEGVEKGLCRMGEEEGEMRE